MWTLRSCKCPLSCIHYLYTEQSRDIRERLRFKSIPFILNIFLTFSLHFFPTKKRIFSLRRSPEVLYMPKASFRWEIVSSKVRNRRDVIFSFADFVGSFGGAAALLLGVNFWNVALVCLKILEKIAEILRCR